VDYCVIFTVDSKPFFLSLVLVATWQAPCHISPCLFFTGYSFPISLFFFTREHLRNRLATWLCPRFVRFHATSWLVNNKHVLLFAGSRMLLHLKRKKRGSSYELLPARPKSNSCHCSVNSGACLHCSMSSFFFFENSGACLHCSLNRVFFF